MNIRLALLFSFVAIFFSAQPSFAFTNLVGALNSGGGVSSNLTHNTTGSIGLFSDAEQSGSSIHWSRAGMLVSFLLHPDLDFDDDGIPDEDDRDDDNDALTDSDELTGIRFIPTTATDPFDSDSDNDGASDSDEAVAGTNPTNALSLFRITGVRREGNFVVVVWQGREGIAYDLAVSDSLTPPNFTVISSNIVATGGVGDWLEVEISATNTPASLQLLKQQ